MSSETHNALRLRRLARVAKLSGAPQAAAAGLELHASVGDAGKKEQPLFTIHAETPGEFAYAPEYAERQDDKRIRIKERA